MSRKIKELMMQEYAEKFAELPGRGCVVCNFRGLDANAASAVRQVLRNHGSEMFVVRNGLLVRSLKDMGIDQMKTCLSGPSAVVMGSDPVQAAKAVDVLREDYPAVTILGGYAEGRVLAEQDVEKLKEIPSREVLLGQTIGLISAPARRFLGGMKNIMAGFASVLHQLKEQRQNEAGE